MPQWSYGLSFPMAGRCHTQHSLYMKATISIRKAALRAKRHLRNPSSCLDRFLRGETIMRPQGLLVALVFLAVLSALPLGKAHEEGGVDASTKLWPCCDECGICTRSLPPICQCRDTSASGCNPACKECARSVDGDGATVFQCKDMIVDFCKRRCTSPAAGDV